MKTSDIDAVTRSLKPITRSEVAPHTWSQLADDITAAAPAARAAQHDGRTAAGPAAEVGGVRRRGQGAGPAARRRRPDAVTVRSARSRLTGRASASSSDNSNGNGNGNGVPGRGRPRVVLVGAFSLLITGLVVASVVRSPSQDQPQALSFTDTGSSVIVRVVDPNADPQRYNAEFKKMGLKVKVSAVPVSPPSVGKLVTYATPDADMGGLRRLEPGEKCSGTLNASDPGCQEGLEVPKNLEKWAEISFGRAARKGEMYHHLSSNIDDPGEVLDGVKFRNKTIAEVKPLLAARDLTIESYREAGNNRPGAKPLRAVPDTWYVHDATSYVAGEVVLEVAETKR